MTKQDAMDELGCRGVVELARALNVSHSTVSMWPDVLPEHAVRRVESVLYRQRARRSRRVPK